MLANVWPEVLEYLLNRKNLSKVEFATDSGISQKMLSRYATGKNRVGKNFKKMAKGAGLTKGRLGYVYAWFLMRFYRPHRFELGIEEESELREPATAYAAPTPRERAQTLVRLDMREVPLELIPTLALLRNKLTAVLEEHDSAVKEIDLRLLELVELYEQHFEAARDLKRKMTSPRGE